MQTTIRYDVECLPEHYGPEGHFASGDDEIDRQDCERIRADLEWNEWAWCTAKVIATLVDENGEDIVSGCAYLGGCNYESEADFRECGYFEDMKDEARAAMLDECRAAMQRCGPIGAYLEAIIDENKNA